MISTTIEGKACMTTGKLGKLEQIDLRCVWKNEEIDFTPWLVEEENLNDLGYLLGIPLEFLEREKAVGPYNADILCRDTDDDRYVVIENQLEVSDHDHLGKLLTYAAHFDASTVIWITKSFTDQHRAAMDWLNEHSDETTRYFGLEIEVWQIGKSDYAPKFNIVAKPNNWTKGALIKGLTTLQQMQLKFWQGFKDYVKDHGELIKQIAEPRPKNWMGLGHNIGRPGFFLNVVASTWSDISDSHELRVHFSIDKKKELAAHFYEQLLSQSEEIEREIGSELMWKDTNLNIYSRRDVTDLFDENARPDQYAWLLEQLEKFYRVFSCSGLIQKLKEPEEPPNETSV